MTLLATHPCAQQCVKEDECSAHPEKSAAQVEDPEGNATNIASSLRC